MDETTEIEKEDPIRDDLNSIAVDLAQVKLTDHGEALRFVAPTGLPVKFRDMLQSYLDAFCFPWNRAIVLPKAPSDEPDASFVTNIINQVCHTFSKCLILRQFRVNADRTRLSEDFGFAHNTFDNCHEVELDFLCVTPRGVTVALTVPAAICIEDFVTKQSIEVLLDWISDMLPDGTGLQLWLLTSSEETPSWALKEAGKVRYRCFEDGSFPADLTGLLSSDPMITDDYGYVKTCSMFVAIWAALIGKRQTVDLGLNILDSKASFLRIAESYIADVAPQWQGGAESYMFPPIFKHPTPEPLFVNVSEDNLPSGGKSIRKNGGGGLSGNLEGSDAEQKVFRSLQQFARRTKNMPLLCFHSLKVDNGIIHVLNKILSSNMNENPFKEKTKTDDGDNFEIDFICICPKHGIILVEVKSAYGDKQEARGRKELRRTEQFLKKFADVLGIPWNDHTCLKIIAFPSSQVPVHPQMKRTELPSDELSNIDAIQILQGSLDFSALLSRLRQDNNSLILSRKIAPAIAILHRIGSKLELKIGRAVKEEADLLNHQQLAGQKVLSELVRINKHTAKKMAQRNSADAVDPVVLKELVNVHFMTPEQMVVWNKGTHQLIYGPPGSGKTILIMGAIADAAKHGMHVRVYCQDATRELYRSFAQSILGGANLVCCKMTEDLEHDFRMTFAKLKTHNINRLSKLVSVLPINVNSDLLQSMKDESQAVLQGQKHPYVISNHKLREKLMIWRKCVEVIGIDEQGELAALRDTCVMVDDLAYPFPEMEWMFVIYCLQQKKFAKLWIARSTGYAFDRDQLDTSVIALSGYSRLSRLSTVLRNARGIYDVWSKWMPDASRDEVKIGHRLEGIDPEATESETGADINLKICDAVQLRLSGTTLSYSDVAVLFGAFSNNLVNSTKKELRNRHIPFAGIAEQAKRHRQGDHVVAVDFVHNSYSYEWPVVFHIKIPGVDENDVIGISRCTTDLTIIDITHRRMSSSDSSNSSDDIEYSMS